MEEARTLQEFIEHSIYILPRLWQGMQITLLLTFGSAFFGTILGLLAALARVSKSRFLGGAATAYVTLFRGTPLLVQILFIYFGLVELGIKLEPFPAGLLAFSLNAGAYIAEIIRAGIQSIDKGQMEAARSLGMSYNQAMRKVIMPQTYRRLLPPMVNELAALTKETSLASVIGIYELLKVGGQIVSRTAVIAQTYIWVAVGYLIVTMSMSALATYFERKLEARE